MEGRVVGVAVQRPECGGERGMVGQDHVAPDLLDQAGEQRAAFDGLMPRLRHRQVQRLALSAFALRLLPALDLLIQLAYAHALGLERAARARS